MVVCLVFDIDDTIFVHKSENIDYNAIQADPKLNKQLQNISYPKYVLTNATFSHANIVLNKMGIHHHFEKIYSRDNIPQMKPSYKSAFDIENDISKNYNYNNTFYFFDDLLENLKMGKSRNWITIWIHPLYQYKDKYNFIDYSFPDIYSALNYFNNNNI